MPLGGGVSQCHLEENVKTTLVDSNGNPYSPANPFPVQPPATGGGLTDAELRAAPVPVVDREGAITPKHVPVAAVGETLIAAPSAGKSIRLWWYNVSADPSNSAHIIVSLRFGSGGTDFYKTALSQYGAATAHSFKAGKSYHQGPQNVSLFINTNNAQTAYVNIDYEEV